MDGYRTPVEIRDECTPVVECSEQSEETVSSIRPSGTRTPVEIRDECTPVVECSKRSEERIETTGKERE